MKTARALGLAAAALTTLLIAVTIARRLLYPYDLEWAEGSMLTHVLRILDGKPLYAPPSIDFIAHPYPPLYPWLLALFARVAGVGYWQARLVSTLSFAGALTVGWRFLRREGASRSIATTAMAIVVAAYAPLGAWFDLARVDSLLLLLTSAGLTLGWQRRHSHLGVAASALLLAAALFTKQTAAPLVLALAIALAITSPRRLPTFVLTLALVGLPSLWWLQHASDGWFWFYVVRMKQSQGVDLRTLVSAPGRVAVLVLPGLLAVGWALLVDRPRPPTLGYVALVAAVAVVISALGRATPAGFVNAYIPGVYFVALATGIAVTRLVARERATAAHWLLTATVILAPAVIPWLGGVLLPSRLVHQPLGYDVAPLVPSAVERARADALLARMRATGGELLIPDHPYYARLAGKQPMLSEMGLTDLLHVDVPVLGLDEAIARGRFAAVILDEPLGSGGPRMQALAERYRHVEPIEGPCVVGGARCTTEWRTLP